MKYKLMAVDVDGTLLDSNSRLTEETKSAIRLGVEKGLVFTISTGRPIQGVQPLADEIGLDLPFITYNGAMVVMGKSREIIYEQNLSPEDTKNIIEVGNKFGTTVVVWSENRLYANELNEKTCEYSKISGIQPALIHDANMFQNGATKVLWYDEVPVIQKYQSEVGKYLGGNVNYHTSRPYFLEFVDKRASKAIAMEKLGEYYGIKREEMIAIGDGLNDLSMIEYAGLGVAMANADEKVKKVAGHITASNDEDGVAKVIRDFIL